MKRASTSATSLNSTHHGQKSSLVAVDVVGFTLPSKTLMVRDFLYYLEEPYP